jgi:hypothetical protein
MGIILQFLCWDMLGSISLPHYTTHPPHLWLSKIEKVITSYAKVRCSRMVMFYSNIQRGWLIRKCFFFSIVTSHYDIHQGLGYVARITTYIKGLVGLTMVSHVARIIST